MRHLELDQVAHSIPGQSTLNLPDLESLTLNRTRPIDLGRDLFLPKLLNPQLQRLVFRNTSCNRPDARPRPASGIQPATDWPSINDGPLANAPPATSFQVRLGAIRGVVSGIEVEPDERAALGEVLARWPGTLVSLDVAALPFAPKFAEAVRASLERGERGIEGLQVLRLPPLEGYMGGEWADRARAEEEVSRLVEAARARGIRVEQA